MPPRFIRLTCLAAGLFALFAIPSHANTIFLDFLAPTGSQYNYSTAEKELIRQRVAADYAPFGHTVTTTQPVSGSFSRIEINATTDFNGNALQGGIANEIDFRNLNPNDRARVNVSGFLTGAQNTSANQVGLAATVAAHECGHLMGLRHGDALGSIGNGLPTARSGALTESRYIPILPSGVPNNANETFTSIMASPASVGQTIPEAAQDTFFNERSAVKLSFNNTGTLTNEAASAHGTIATAQNVNLATLIVPNTIPQFIPGSTTPTVNFGKTFDVSALAVLGNIANPNEQDYFSFSANGNDLFNFEVISDVLSANGVARYNNSVDSLISIFDSAGNLVPYYNGTAQNDDEFESTDSILIDLVIPTTGTYYARVNGYTPSSGTPDTGNYELFMYRFNAITPADTPESGSLLLGGMDLWLWLWRGGGRDVKAFSAGGGKSAWASANCPCRLVPHGDFD